MREREEAERASGEDTALAQLLARHDMLLRGVLDEVNRDTSRENGSTEMSDEAVRREVIPRLISLFLNRASMMQVEAQLVRAARKRVALSHVICAASVTIMLNFSAGDVI